MFCSYETFSTAMLHVGFKSFLKFTDGGWTRWSNWSTCSLTCGYGFRKRTRSCTNPRPKGSGKKCLGRSVMIIICAYNPCPEG